MEKIIVIIEKNKIKLDVFKFAANIVPKITPKQQKTKSFYNIKINSLKFHMCHC